MTTKALLTERIAPPPRDAEPSLEPLARRIRAAGRALANHGLVRADGECSVRLGDGALLVSPDLPLGLVGAGTPCRLVTIGAELPAATPPHASLHAAIYRARPDVQAIIRAKPPRASALCASDTVATKDAVRLLDDGAILRIGRDGVLSADASLESAMARLWELEEVATLASGGLGFATIDPPSASAIVRIWRFMTAGDTEADPAAADPAALPRPPETFDFWRSPGHLLRRCTQRGHDIFHEVLVDRPVTRQQFAVLWAIRDTPGSSQQRLSEATGFDRNTMAGILARLGEQDLILRSRDAEDGRLYRIHLTPQAEALLEGMVPDLLEIQRRVLEPLPSELRATFVQCARMMIGLPPT